MAINTITINFAPCFPTPADGYRVFYQEVGGGPLIEAVGPFLSSPIVFEVTGAENQAYEGYIVADCGGPIGAQVPWESSGSASDSAPTDTDGIMHLFSAESYAIMELKDLAYWNSRYLTSTNADTPFDEIILDPDDLKIILKGATNLIMENIWEDFQEEALGLKGFWDNSGSVIEADGSFAFAVNLEVVEMLYTTIFNDNVFAGCTGLLSILAPAATSFGALIFQDCGLLVNVSFPLAVSCGNNCFQNCTSIENIDLSACTDLGGTTGDNNVFAGITGQTITLTIPTATATDGDVVTLQANNTVTLILV